jgi:DNA-binding MarR family transcriptional regulator
VVALTIEAWFAKSAVSVHGWTLVDQKSSSSRQGIEGRHGGIDAFRDGEVAAYRLALAVRGTVDGVDGDIREPHMQIFGNVRMGGVRLTELAERASLSLAAASELVNDLQDMDYLIRRPDPADGRAKLIDLTPRGRAAMSAAGRRVTDIERRWSQLVGPKDFDRMCATMQRLLDEVDPEQSRS